MANRIREKREELKLSQADLAELVGVHWQSVHRAESGKTTLSTKKKAMYARALSTDVSSLFDAETFRTVRVRGYVQAGHWAETWEFADEDQYDVPIPNEAAFAQFSLYGAELRGPSMNKRYSEGAVVIFTDAIETHEDLILGKRYVVERQRADGLREATVKTLWRDENGTVWLLPESTDPRFQEPIPIEGGEDDTVRVVGRVRYAVSRE